MWGEKIENNKYYTRHKEKRNGVEKRASSNAVFQMGSLLVKKPRQ